MAATPPGWPRLMDEETAAAYLGVSASTLNRLKSEHHIIPRQVRSLLRYHITDLDALADSFRDAEPKQSA